MTSRLLRKILTIIIRWEGMSIVSDWPDENKIMVRKDGKAYVYLYPTTGDKNTQVVSQISSFREDISVGKIYIATQRVTAFLKQIVADYAEVELLTIADIETKYKKNCANITCHVGFHDISKLDRCNILHDVYRNVVIADIARNISNEYAGVDLEKAISILNSRIISTYASFAPSHLTHVVQSAISKNGDNYDAFWKFKLVVLKADIRGYSDAINVFLGRNFDKGLIECMKEWIVNVNNAAMLYDAILDKFMGDGFIAYFGFPDLLDKNPKEISMSVINFVKDINLLTKKLSDNLYDKSGMRTAPIGLRIALSMCDPDAYVTLSNSDIDGGRGHLLAFGECIVVADRLEKISKPGFPTATVAVKRYIEQQIRLNCDEIKIMDQTKKLIGDKCYQLIKAESDNVLHYLTFDFGVPSKPEQVCPECKFTFPHPTIP